MNDPTWRDRYYALSIVQMLAIAHELNKSRRRSRTSQEPYPDLLSNLRSQLSHLDTASTQASPIFEPVHQQHIAHSATPFTSPTEMSRSPSRASPISSVGLSEDWSRCTYEECPATFKAGPDQKSNCKRHIRKQHEEVETFECPDDKCEGKFRNRWNLKRHVEGHHPHLVTFLGQSSPTYVGKGKARAYG